VEKLGTGRQVACKIRVCQNAADRAGERGRVFGSGEKAGDLMLDHVFRSAAAGRHDGNPASHRLQHRQPEALLAGRAYEDVQGRQIGGGLADVPGEDDVCRYAQVPRERLDMTGELGPYRRAALADQRQRTSSRRKRSEHLYRDVLALPRFYPPHHADERAAVMPQRAPGR